MMKWLRLTAAWIGGAIAAAVLFVGVTAICWELVAIYTYLTEPYTAAADVGWLRLMVLFFAGPFIGVGSAVGGMFAGTWLNNKMRERIQPAD
jgi:hypothetical protein